MKLTPNDTGDVPMSFDNRFLMNYPRDFLLSNFQRTVQYNGSFCIDKNIKKRYNPDK